MRICVLGNQDNAGYRFANWLRARGHEADLYLMTHWESERSNPAAIDRSLATEGYPSWIHRFHNSIPHVLFGGSPEIAEIERGYDAVLVIGSMAMTVAYRIKKIPVVCLSTGPGVLGVIRMFDQYGLKYRAFWTLMRFHMRRSVRSCAKILVHYDPELSSLKQLGELGKAQFYGMPEDVAGNRGRVDRQLLDELTTRYGAYDRVFVWLSRVDYTDPSTPMYKGTDKFIRAAAQVIQEGANVRLLIGAHGHDSERARALVEELGIADHVDWVPHLPFWKMLTYLSIPNAIVFDELTPLNAVSSGMLREALSVGAVVVRSYSPLLTNAGYGSDACPVHHALTQADTYGQMKTALAWDAAHLKDEQRRSLCWAERYLDPSTRIDMLVRILEEVMYSERIARELGSRS